MCILLPPWVSSDKQKTEAWVHFFLKHTDNPELEKRNQLDKHCFFVQKHRENTCCNKLRDVSRQQNPEHSQAILENESQWFPPLGGTGKESCKAKGKQLQWLQGTPLAQHLWKSMLSCKYLRKNLALGTFKNKSSLFFGYINVYIKLTLLWSPLHWLERGSIGCIFWCTVPVPFHLYPFLDFKNTSASRCCFLLWCL